MARFVVAERDNAVATALSEGFRDRGFSVAVTGDGVETMHLASDARTVMLVMDVNLGHVNGYEVCRRLRADGNLVPIILLANQPRELDCVNGLRLGADDFVGMPFSMMEMMARVEAVLRRVERSRGISGQDRFGDLTIDFQSFQAWFRGEDLDLTAREFEVLSYLARRRGQTVTREQLLHDVWRSSGAIQTRTVDVHVAKLRRKIEPGAGSRPYIVTNRGLGYKFLG